MPEDKEEKLIWLTKKRVFTTLELMEILSKPNDYDLFIEKGIARAEGRLPMPEQRSEATDEDIVGTTVIPDIRYSPNLSMASANGQSVTIFGRGSGHGVGMSQWGAKTMAERGWNFRQILEYYFPGTTIGQ
jgi:stage II sporulation protein D